MASVNLEELLNRLSSTPDRIAHAVSGWSESVLRTTPSASDWSAAAILAHLRASDAIITYRLYAILVRDNPPMPAFDERRWAEVAGYTQADFAASLRLFALRRAELITMLRGLAPDDWQRTGTHEVNGAFTLLAAVTHLVEHEEEHCLQLEALRVQG
jgi:hypothetical protein